MAALWFPAQAEARKGCNAKCAAKMVQERQRDYDVARAFKRKAAAARALRGKRYWQAKHMALTAGNGGSPSANRRLARHLALAKHGWSGPQFQCLVTLWAHESGWDHRAVNSGSGATGIPQALPGSKMRSAGPNIMEPRTQILWGLGYVRGRYGTPCGALGFWNGHGWY